MSVSVEEIQELSVAERLQLLDTIWGTLAPEDVPITEGQKRELDRRLEAHRRDPASGSIWHDVKSRLCK